MGPTEGSAGRLGAAGFPQGTNSKPIVAECDGDGKQADALTRLGEMLKATPKNTGAAGGGKKDAPRGSIVEPRDTTPTLADLGIDKKVSK